jgi:outer membrane protein assembly factor BamB
MALLAVPASGAAPPLVRTLTPGAAPFNGLQIALADFRGDGHVAAVVQSDDGRVLVVDPASGTLLATLRPGNAGCTSTCYSFEGISGPINAPVVADLDRDGRLDLILSNTAAVVARYTFDPAASSATHFAFTKLWEHRYNQYQSFTTMDATPAVADLDGNGQLDLVVVTEENGLFAVRPDGTTLWASSRHGGHAGASVADLDRDGKPDVVVATDDGLVQALVAKTGAVRWTFDAPSCAPPASRWRRPWRT